MLVKFEQNRMVRTTRHEYLSFLTKKQKTKQNKTKQNKKTCFFLNHFWQSVGAILEDVFVAETIVKC